MRIRPLVLVILGLSLLGSSCGAAQQPESRAPDRSTVQTPTAVTEASSGVTERGDVTAVRWAPIDPSVPTWRYIETDVTNNSSETSDYWIELSITNADGSIKLGTDWVIVNRLEPGQRTTERSLSTARDITDDAVLKIVNVDRTASN